jgi:hypothetical protein
MSSRISEHPILGEQQKGKLVTFTYDGKELQGYEGEPIAAALKAAGVMVHRYTKKEHKPRGIFCAIGRCTDCDGCGWKTKCPHLHDTACRGHESPDTVRRIG